MRDTLQEDLASLRQSRGYRAGTLLKRLHLGLSALVDARLHAHGLHLTRPQALALMVLLEHPGASNAELARLNGVSPQTMHQTLARLERDRLVARSPHPRLKRVQAHVVTEEGAAMVGRGARLARAALDEALGALDAEEQAHLIALLERCADRLPSADG